MSGTDPFLVAIDKFIAKANAKSDLVVQAIAQDALARVKELTPVKTGYLRSNWTVIRNGDGAALTSASNDRTEESLAVVLSLKSGDSFTITNPVSYARRIEYGFVGVDSAGRHFNQRGVGMMAQTMTELPQIAAKAVLRVLGDQP